jgi:hypothetical protein
MKGTTDHEDGFVEAFNRKLDRFLETGRIPEDAELEEQHLEMLSIARSLAAVNVMALSKGHATLRKRLLSNEALPGRQRMRRTTTLATSLALLALILGLALAVSPPFRAWAQEVLARVYNLLITDAPTEAERALPMLLTATPQAGPSVALNALSPEEASLRVGFTVLVPRSIPEPAEEDIYAVPWGADRLDRWELDLIENGVVVFGVYKRWYPVRILQRKLPGGQEEEFPIGDARVKQVLVRGRTGYWIEEAATDIIGGGGSIFLGIDDVEWQLAYNNILVWSEGGIVYAILGDDELTLDDLVTIAESLAP